MTAKSAFHAYPWVRHENVELSHRWRVLFDLCYKPAIISAKLWYLRDWSMETVVVRSWASPLPVVTCSLGIGRPDEPLRLEDRYHSARDGDAFKPMTDWWFHWPFGLPTRTHTSRIKGWAESYALIPTPVYVSKVMSPDTGPVFPSYVGIWYVYVNV